MSPAEEAIERLLALFGEPKTSNPERFLEEYRKALTGIDSRVLERATDRIITKSTFWPKPAEIIAEAHHIASQLYSHRPTDWDAVDKDRREGWSVSDLKRYRSEETRARVQGMVDELKANIAAMEVEPKDDVDWLKGQQSDFEDMQALSPNGTHRTPAGLTQRSRRMMGDE